MNITKYKLTITTLIIVLCAFITFGQTQTETRELLPDQTLTRETTGAETHRYKFDLKKDEFFQVRVEQKGVDVMLKLLDADGTVLATMDSPNGMEGFEILSFIADKAGDFFLEVIGFDPKAEKGIYIIKRETSRTATAQDKRRIEVEKLFVEGMTARDTEGQSETAVKKLEEALTGWRDLKDQYLTELTVLQINQLKRTKADAIFNEAYGLFQQGTAESFKSALIKFQEASRLYEEINDKSENAGLSLLGSGLISDNLGEKAAALKYYDKALIFFRAIENESWEATTLSNIGLVYSDLGDNQKALEYYNQSLPLRRQVGDKSGEATTLNNIGGAYSDLGDNQKALEYFNQSLPLIRQVGDKSGEARTLSNIGGVYSDLGDNQKALEYYNQSLPLRRQVGDKSGEATTLNNIMFVWQSLKNPTLAVFYGKQSVNVYQQLRSNITGLDKEIQKTYLKSIDYTYRGLADIMIADGRLLEAQAVLDLIKTEEFSGILRRSGNDEQSVPYSQAETAALEVLDRLAALGREKGDLEEKNEKDSLTDTEKQRFRDIAKQIEIAEAEFNKSIATLSDAKNKGQDFEAVVKDAQAFMSDLKSLGKGTVALYTVIVNNSRPLSADGKPASDEKEEIKTGWIILVTPEFRKQYSIDIRDLEKTIFTFREALRTDRYDPQPIARNLYEKMFRQKGKDGKTLEADLNEYFKDKPEKTLMWSLDGILRYVPMAALHDGGNYLVEKYRNTMFNTASKARLKDQPKTNWTVLGLGVSEERRESGKTFPQITGAKRELQAIVRTGNDTGILNGTIKLDANFTAEAMQDALLFDKNPVVHIASHFSFDLTDTDGSKSFLLMGKGKMTVQEMTAKSGLFGNVDLLALSACDTAMGSGNGKEVEGFAYVAQSLGAKSVLASLWQVSDTGTDELMIRFYKLRSENPQMSKGEAFRQAQLSLFQIEKTPEKAGESNKSRAELAGNAGNKIVLPLYKKDEKKPFAHPHYWSSFVLIGNWR